MSNSTPPVCIRGDEFLYNNIHIFNPINDLLDKSIFFETNGYLLLKNVLTDEIKKYLKDNIYFDDSCEDPRNPINDKRQFYRQHHDNGNTAPADFITKIFLIMKLY
jgi:hypothetical protein